MKKAKIFSVIVMGILIIAAILYDIFALFYWGSEATFSSIINVWAFQAHPLLVCGFGMIIGGLIVHFFGWAPTKKQRNKMRYDKITLNEAKKMLAFPVRYIGVDKIKSLKVEFNGHQYPNVELTYNSRGEEKVLKYRIRDDYIFARKEIQSK